MKYLTLLFALSSIAIASPVLGEQRADGKAEAMRFMCTHLSYTLDGVYLKCSEDGMRECDTSAAGMKNEFQCWSDVAFVCKLKMDSLSVQLDNMCTKFLSAGGQ